VSKAGRKGRRKVGNDAYLIDVKDTQLGNYAVHHLLRKVRNKRSGNHAFPPSLPPSLPSIPLTLGPVKGNVHSFKIFLLSPLAVCSIVTTTRFPLPTRSMAPPMPKGREGGREGRKEGRREG